MKSDSVIVNVRIPSGRHRAHTCVEPLSPRGARICTLPFGDAWAPWLYPYTKAVRPEPNDQTRKTCGISLPNRYMNSEVVIVHLRDVHWCLATHGRPGRASTQRPSGRSQLIPNAKHVPYHSHILYEIRLRHCKRSNSVRPAPCPHVRGALEPPGRKDLYIAVWRRMGALVVQVHKGRQAGAK